MECKDGLAPGVSDMIDRAVQRGHLPLASSPFLCRVCFTLLTTVGAGTCATCREGQKRKRKRA